MRRQAKPDRLDWADLAPRGQGDVASATGKGCATLGLMGLVVSIGLADSVNPGTIAPGLYFAMGQRPKARLIQFTLGLLGVTFVGGMAIALGPGEALLALVPKPSPTARYIGETVAGVVMLVAAAVLFHRRERLAQHEPRSPARHGKSALLLGVTIGAVELPTAFPYLAAIAAVVDSGFGPVNQVIVLAVFNLAFGLPLLLMIATLTVAPDRAAEILQRARDWLQPRWPTALAVLALIAGIFVLTLGITGLAG